MTLSPGSSLGRCASRQGAIGPRNARFRRLAQEGVWWTAAHTEVLLGESPHDPGTRCAGPSVSGRTHPSQHRGHLSGFGCIPGLSSDGALEGDDARSRPSQPHRDDTSGSARVSGDPGVGQQRLQVHLVRGQGHQERTHIRGTATRGRAMRRGNRRICGAQTLRVTLRNDGSLGGSVYGRNGAKRVSLDRRVRDSRPRGDWREDSSRGGGSGREPLGQ